MQIGKYSNIRWKITHPPKHRTLRFHSETTETVIEHYLSPASIPFIDCERNVSDYYQILLVTPVQAHLNYAALYCQSAISVEILVQ